ncbi:MAG: GNAT family N-acetyltransferase [Chitinophagales bacterium]|nr:GNAT family N-acetyltransferase [Chitinophagales bacterium]
MRIIRELVQSDNKELARIIRASFHEFNAPTKGTVYSDPSTDNLFDLFQTPKSKLLVLELDGKIAGCCGIYPSIGLPKSCVELVKFYLAPEARSKGLGKEIFAKCLVLAEEYNYREVYIESLPQFDRAIHIYKKFEFETLDAPLGNSVHPACNIWMLKKL